MLQEYGYDSFSIGESSDDQELHRVDIQPITSSRITSGESRHYSNRIRFRFQNWLQIAVLYIMGLHIACILWRILYKFVKNKDSKTTRENSTSTTRRRQSNHRRVREVHTSTEDLIQQGSTNFHERTGSDDSQGLSSVFVTTGRREGRGEWL